MLIITNSSFKNEIDTLDKMINEYIGSYKKMESLYDDIQKWKDENKITLPKRYVPTEKEKYELSLKQIEEKNNEVKEKYSEALYLFNVNLKKYSEEIGYKDIEKNIKIFIDTMPNIFTSVILNSGCDEHGLNYISFVSDVVNLAKYSLKQ